MRFAIVGAGAVGGLLGALLSRGGSEVAFVARGATRARLREKGLRIRGVHGDFEVGPFEAEEDPAKVAPADAVVVTVKSWQLRPLAPKLRPLIGPAGIVLSLQNGVEAADTLIEALGAAPVLGGLCYVFAAAEAPGQVSVQGPPLRVTVGELDGTLSLRIQALTAALQDAGVTVSIATDVRAAIWEKLLFVGPVGMIGAATRLTSDRYRALGESRGLVQEAMAEVHELARAEGVRVPEEAVSRAMARLDGLPEGSTTSMQRDLEAGRPSELEEQIGVIVRFGARAGLAVPVHRVLHAALAARARQAQP